MGSVNMRAMKMNPEDFEDIEAFILLQPLSADAFVRGVTRNFGLEHEDNIKHFSDPLKRKTGYIAEQCSDVDVASPVKMPTLLTQVRKDFRTTNEDIENLF